MLTLDLIFLLWTQFLSFQWVRQGLRDVCTHNTAGSPRHISPMLVSRPVSDEQWWTVTKQSGHHMGPYYCKVFWPQGLLSWLESVCFVVPFPAIRCKKVPTSRTGVVRKDTKWDWPLYHRNLCHRCISSHVRCKQRNSTGTVLSVTLGAPWCPGLRPGGAGLLALELTDFPPRDVCLKQTTWQEPRTGPPFLGISSPRKSCKNVSLPVMR